VILKLLLAPCDPIGLYKNKLSCKPSFRKKNSYFAFMLLDVLNMSSTLSIILRSVTDNFLALGLVFYLIICAVIIYAQFGLQNFEEHFSYGIDDDEGQSRRCGSAISCAFLIIYKAVPSGDLSEIMDPLVKVWQTKQLSSPLNFHEFR